MKRRGCCFFCTIILILYHDLAQSIAIIAREVVYFFHNVIMAHLYEECSDIHE